MIKRIAFAAAAALTVAACSQPTITGASRDHVVVKFDNWVSTEAEVVAKADAECARHGKRAELVESISDGPTREFRYNRYDCVGQ